MEEDRNSYKSITKSIGIFGGTKIFQILVGIIKNKIIAVLLGPYGMGISGMITSTTDMVFSFSGLGLQTSAVRDVAQAHSSGNQDRINRTITVLRKLIWFTGLLGFIIVFVFAEQFSLLSFGNEEWTWGFRIVSITLLINQLIVGQNVLLQGTFHYKYLAEVALISSVLGLILTVPLFYFWRIKAIVPALCITALINLLISSHFSRKIKYTRVKISTREVLIEGKIMISLGLAFALAGLINSGKVYIVRYFLEHLGTLETVGLYTAGYAIATQYIDVILQAMGTDYTPRLSSVADNVPLFIETINRQSILLVTIVSPFIMLFVVFAPELIKLLYSSKFIPITGMITWMMFGMFFRAMSWSMSFSYAARGDARLFLVNEIIIGVISLPCFIIGYYVLGFLGIGIGFCLTYVFYTIQNYIICHKQFGFSFNKEVIIKCFPLIALCFVFILLLQFIDISWMRYVVGVFFLAVISLISLRRMDQMIGLKSSIAQLKSKIIKRNG